MMFKPIFAACLMSVAPLAAIADTPLLNASDPARIVKLMQAEGYKATLSRTDDGRPEIESAANGNKFWIYFGACNADGSDCELLTFGTGFDFKSPQADGPIKAWNGESYGAAWLDDEGDPHLSLDVNMLHGVSEKNFIDTLNWFASLSSDFAEKIGWEDE